MITPSYALTATERVLPNLALDFTTASLDARVTFTRTGNTATVTNSSGYVVGINANLPRFDYNPVTLVCNGLLIEESRINILPYSNLLNFAQTAYWIAANATVSANAGTSPDGTNNAFALYETATSGTHPLNQAGIVTVNASTYTLSIYLKANGRTSALLQMIGTAVFPSVNINLTTGALGTINGTATATSTNAGNGWWRVSITAATDTIATQFRIYPTTGDNVISYAGDITKGILASSAQMEPGAFPTSYIPNAAATTTTRNADNATMTGTNFSSWFTGGATNSTFQVNFIYPNAKTAGGQRYLGFNGFTGFLDTGGFLGFYDGTGTRVLGTMVASNNTKKYAIGFSGTTCSAGKDSALATAAYSSAAFAPTAMYLWYGQSTTVGELNGTIKQIYYWPQRLTNAELQAFSK